MKCSLEETEHILQTISTDNFLPYENLQVLKCDFDNMQEDLNDKLKLMDEIIQDLINDQEKWKKFNDELQRLEKLFKEIDSSFVTQMSSERTLEDKQEFLEVK